MQNDQAADNNRTRVMVVTRDADFENSVRATFGSASAIDLAVATQGISHCYEKLDVDGAAVVVIDIDEKNNEEMAALARLLARLGTAPPVVAVTQSFEE